MGAKLNVLTGLLLLGISAGANAADRCRVDLSIQTQDLYTGAVSSQPVNISNSLPVMSAYCSPTGTSIVSPAERAAYLDKLVASSCANARNVANMNFLSDGANSPALIIGNSVIAKVYSETVFGTKLVKTIKYDCAGKPVLSCPKQKLALSNLPLGDGTVAKCEGYMPSKAVDSKNVFGTNDAGQYVSGPTGSACKFGNVQGAHYHTLTGTNVGTCKNYCTIIADCNSTGQWVNIRHAW